MPFQDPTLQIDVAHGSGPRVIHIQGELDLAGCPALELALLTAEQSQADRIVLDLDGLTFIDSCGLNILVEAARRSVRNGGRLQMTRGNGQVAHLLSFTGLDSRLPNTGCAADVFRTTKTDHDTIPNGVVHAYAEELNGDGNRRVPGEEDRATRQPGDLPGTRGASGLSGMP